MKTLKLYGALAAIALGGGLSTAQAEQLVLEEVVVTATARPAMEFVVVVAELPERLRAAEPENADEPFQTVLAVERPRLDASEPMLIEPALPILSL